MKLTHLRSLLREKYQDVARFGNLTTRIVGGCEITFETKNKTDLKNPRQRSPKDNSYPKVEVTRIHLDSHTESTQCIVSR